MSTKRIQYDQSHWQYLVESQAQSGLNGAQFCREHQVAYTSFMSWRKRLQAAPVQPATKQPSTFVELTAPVSTSSTEPTDQEPGPPVCVELSLGAGIELRITRSA